MKTTTGIVLTKYCIKNNLPTKFSATNRKLSRLKKRTDSGSARNNCTDRSTNSSHDIIYTIVFRWEYERHALNARSSSSSAMADTESESKCQMEEWWFKLYFSCWTLFELLYELGLSSILGFYKECWSFYFGHIFFFKSIHKKQILRILNNSIIYIILL